MRIRQKNGIDFNWSSKSITHNVFRFFESIFGRKYGIRAEISAGMAYHNGELIEVQQAHSFEGACALVETSIRDLFKFKIPVKIWIPKLSTVGGLPSPYSPYLFAIAFDANLTGSVNPGTTFSYTHTVTGSNVILLDSFAVNKTTDPVTAATYNSVAMTLLTTKAAATTSFLQYLYYQIGPSTGANSVSFTTSTSESSFSASVSYSGVSQTGFPDSQATGTSASGNYTATTTVVGSNCWLFCASRTNGTPTGGTGTTVRDSVNNGSVVSGDSNGTVSTGSQSLNFTVTPGGECAWIIVSFAPPTVTGNTTPTPQLLTLKVG